jgi:hypothetical protein
MGTGQGACRPWRLGRSQARPELEGRRGSWRSVTAVRQRSTATSTTTHAASSAECVRATGGSPQRGDPPGGLLDACCRRSELARSSRRVGSGPARKPASEPEGPDEGCLRSGGPILTSSKTRRYRREFPAWTSCRSRSAGPTDMIMMPSSASSTRRPSGCGIRVLRVL